MPDFYMWYVVLIICGVLFLSIWSGWLIYQTKQNRKEISQIQKTKDFWEEEYNNERTKNEKLAADINQLSVARKLVEQEAYLAAVEKDQLKIKIEELQNELLIASVNAVKNDSAEDLDHQLTQLKNLIDIKSAELEQISVNTKQLTELQEKKILEIGELDSSMKALEGRIVSGEALLKELEGEIKVTEVALADLANLKASILAFEEGAGQGWTFTPGDKKRLVELIHQLVDEYGSQFPILKKELLKAEWSSVWLPQVQQLCSREGLDRSGIYRLTLKSNPDCVYIGQAQSIKDRWYIHIKKMLGVEAKGSERLYEYGPDDFEWSVVEFKEGNL